MKKLIFLLIIVAAVLPFIVNSQETSPQALEVEYIPLPNVELPTATTTLPNYVKYIFVFGIVTAGFIALVVIVVAGFQYMSSAGDSGKLGEAKERIKSALLGLLILLCSWLILNTINPELTYLRPIEDLPGIIPDLKPGVYLCKSRVDIPGFWDKSKQAQVQDMNSTGRKEIARELVGILKTIDENCIGANPIEGKSDIHPEMEGKVTHVYLVPAYQEKQYGAILYEEKAFGGKSNIYYKAGDETEKPREWTVKDIQASSVRPFIINHNPDPSWYAMLYEGVHKNEGDKKLKKEKCDPGGSTDAASICQIPKNKDGKNEVGSVEIEGGMFIIFLKESANWVSSSDNYVVANPGEMNLNNTELRRWKAEECIEKREPDWRDRPYPCAEKAVLVAADFY